MYDAAGIYVYEFDSYALTGFCNLSEINPTAVEADATGRLVKFYDDTTKYIYDVRNNEVLSVDSYDSYADFEPYEPETVASSDYFDSDYPIYKGQDGTLSSVIAMTESKEIRYSDLYIQVLQDSTIETYSLFQ